MNTLENTDMNKSNSKLFDLPDEIFLIIFKHLTMLDVFSSLVDVDRRFRRLATDSRYVRRFDLTDMMIIRSLCNQPSSIDTRFLPRFSEQILPRIHHHIQQLTVEQSSIKSLLTVNYPQLHSLSLVNFEEEILYQHLTDDSVLRNLLKQVTNLSIKIKKPEKEFSPIVRDIFALVISQCKQLTALNFCYMFTEGECEASLFPPPRDPYLSSTLTKLKINVASFFDCFQILDGRFDCLSTFIVKVRHVIDFLEIIDGGEALPKLKCFSFTSLSMISDYDELVVPLLQRMTNLEELQLYLPQVTRDLFNIDGNDLWYKFLDRMTQLKKFRFHIRTTVEFESTEIPIPTNESIQQTFKGRNYPPVASFMTKRPKCYAHDCHIYSLPYDFEYYHDLDNDFPGGMFARVRQLKMGDTVSFDHHLFEVVAHDFPLLESLHISNTEPIQDKEQSCGLIVFPYLTLLDLRKAHVDYSELLLLQTKTHFRCLLNLSLKFSQLTKITKNFTEDPTQFNLTTLKSLDVCQSFGRPENFDQYCPLL